MSAKTLCRVLHRVPRQGVQQVNISVAIMPMAKDFGWSSSVSGLVQSSFFYGYILTQIPGGWVTSRLGGRKVMPAGVTLWSVATAAVPLLAGTLPGAHWLSHTLDPCIGLIWCCFGLLHCSPSQHTVTSLET